MTTKTRTKTAKPRPSISVEEAGQGRVRQTCVRIGPDVNVGTLDGWIHLWEAAGHEVRIGPLSPEQAEKLSEDLGYEAVV